MTGWRRIQTCFWICSAWLASAVSGDARFPPLFIEIAAPVAQECAKLDAAAATDLEALSDAREAVDALITAFTRNGILDRTQEQSWRRAAAPYRQTDRSLVQVAAAITDRQISPLASGSALELQWRQLMRECKARVPHLVRVSRRVLQIGIEQFQHLAASETTTAGQIESLEDFIESRQELLLLASENDVWKGGPDSFISLLRDLNTYRAGLLAETLKRLTPFSDARRRQNEEITPPSFLSTAQWESFTRKAVLPFAERMKAQQQKMDRAFFDWRAPDEIAEEMSKFSGLCAELGSFRDILSAAGYGTSWSGSEMIFFRNGLLQGVSGLDPFSCYRPPPGSDSSEMQTFCEQLNAKQKRNFAEFDHHRAEMADAIQRAREQRVQAEEAARLEEEKAWEASFISGVRARLAAITAPAELFRLADELPSHIAPLPRAPGKEALAAVRKLLAAVPRLQTDLRRLAAAWGEGKLISPSSRRVFHVSPPGGELLSPEINQLSDRALRWWLAQTLPAPELMSSPVDTGPLDQDVRSAAQRAGAAGNWRQAYDLLAFLSEESPALSQRQAIKSYLIGLNYEKAEQYPQALAAYQCVVGQLLEHIPIVEATVRLKALRLVVPLPDPSTSPASRPPP